MTLSDQPFATLSCPYCGELNDIVIDPEEVGHILSQDCWVCCRPIEVFAEWDAEIEQVKIHLRTENE